MKLVLDSNVVVAAFCARGLCSDLFKASLFYDLFASEMLLREISRTLSSKIKLPKNQVQDIDLYLRTVMTMLDPAPVATAACRDSSDLHILGLALKASADLLITGDPDLLVLKSFKRTKIVDPRKAWEKLRRRLHTM